MSELADTAENNTGRGLIYALEDIRDQLALSNRIALAALLKDQYGAYSPSLFEAEGGLNLLVHGESPDSNVRLAENVRSTLGLYGVTE